MYKNEAFQLGESFHRVACDMNPGTWPDIDENDDCHWFVPSIVNMAFACELYLKSLISKGPDFMEGHDWEELFAALSQQQQTAIVNDPHFKDDNDFIDKLKEGARIFIDWRYCCEHKKEISVDFIFLEEFAYVLHDLAEKEVSLSQKDTIT